MKRKKPKKSVRRKKRRARKIKLPKYALEVIFDLMKKYGTNKNAFGYHSNEDISQEVFLICAEIWTKYDKTKGELRPFMEKSLRNRLKNFKRDSYFRPTPPCVLHRCDKFTPDTDISTLKCKEKCSKYIAHQEMIRRKMNIMNTLSFDSGFSGGSFYNGLLKKRCASDETDPRFLELDAKIKKELDLELHSSYERLKRGLQIPKDDLAKIRLLVSCILVGEEYGEGKIDG